MALQVTTTLGSQAEAMKLAAGLVNARLAACVQIDGPITSLYRWQGQVQTDQEWRCSIKTANDLYSQVEAFIRENHPYDLPEIVSVRAEGYGPYLRWLAEQTDSAAESDE